MRFRRSLVFVCLCFALTTRPTLAAKRLTDVRGGEVRIVRAPVVPQTKKVVATGRRAGRNAASVTVTAGPDTDAANNDYRRIQNALDAVASGDTIHLTGTFDFTAPFAAAAWALGDDGVAATADDYEVLAPRGVNNVTLIGDPGATIQGPGDLPAIDLESFLIFDPSVAPGGTNTGWTIQTLQILDFDLSIGMFAVAAGDFTGTTITNNVIRIPTDLNATVAPSDTLQNIGIHFSFGANQSITGNTFNIPGDGVSNGANFSSSVVMQSNTSGGSTYDGLTISNNVIHILNAQSANPQVTLGIWDNCHAHTSNITISNNQFINDAAGNDPALNLERAFRVTSHSGAASTVLYSGNQIAGANIGFQWITGSNFTGNQAVRLSQNTITNSATGVLVQSSGVAHLEQNTITGSGAGGGVHVITGTLTAAGANANSVFRNFVTGGSGDGILIDATAGAIDPIAQNDLSGNTGFGLNNLSAPMIVAETNWWGNNLAPNVAPEVSGNVDFDPWLASGTDVSPATAGFQPFIYATTSGALTTFVGTPGADTGALLAGDPVTMQMDGDTAFTPLAQLLNFDIQLDASDDFFTLGQTHITTTLDGGPGNDTLIGTNVAQQWTINGANNGNIPNAGSFNNVESLRGGTAADSFTFGPAGSIANTVDGNLGIDTLDNSAIPGHVIVPTGPGTLDGFMGTATGIGGTFDNINLVANASDMSVVKTGPATATAGTIISYTITVTNNGPDPAINASLTDAIPAGTTFSSLTSPGGWSCTTPSVGGTGTITCSMASVPVGPNVFTLNVNAPAAPAAVSNTANVSSASTDGVPGNNSSTANTTVVFTADVSVVKTATATAAVGSNVTYGITVTNNGPSTATTVSMTDALPANTTFVSETQPTGPAFTCTNPTAGTNGTVTCNIASMASGATATFTIVANVGGAITPGLLFNTATVTTTSTDPVAGNNTSTASTVITTALSDVGITKTASAGPYFTSTPVTYTMVVNNAGPDNAPNTNVTDVLPAGTTFVSAVSTQGSCTGTTTVTCSLGTLNNGGTASITLVVTLPATPGPVTNTASVSSFVIDANPANNTGTSLITVNSAASIPALSPIALLLLSLTLGIAGVFVQRRM